MVQVEVKALFIGDNACIRPLMLPEDIRTRSKLWNIGYMHVCGFFLHAGGAFKDYITVDFWTATLDQCHLKRDGGYSGVSRFLETGCA